MGFIYLHLSTPRLSEKVPALLVDEGPDGRHADWVQVDYPLVGVLPVIPVVLHGGHAENVVRRNEHLILRRDFRPLLDARRDIASLRRIWEVNLEDGFAPLELLGAGLQKGPFTWQRPQGCKSWGFWGFGMVRVRV